MKIFNLKIIFIYILSRTFVWTCVIFFNISSAQFSRLVVSDSLRPRESQHARPPYPSPTPGVHRRKLNWVFFFKVNQSLEIYWLSCITDFALIHSSAVELAQLHWKHCEEQSVTEEHRSQHHTLCPCLINMLTGRRAENSFIYTDGFRVAETSCPVPTVRVEQWLVCNDFKALMCGVWLKKNAVFSLKEKKLRYPWELHS